MAADPSWQAREGTGYASGAFVIDWDTRRATCPQGHVSGKAHVEFDAGGQAMIQFRFAKKVCQACPARARCTKAREEPRSVTVRTQAHYEVLQAARQRQTTAADHGGIPRRVCDPGRGRKHLFSRCKGA